MGGPASVVRSPHSKRAPRSQCRVFVSAVVFDCAGRGPHHQAVMALGTNRPLRRGDIVEVRPAAEILATLDENGAYDDMPFMPEMLQYVGRRFTVSRRVEKICDTIAVTGSRRMHDTVYLEDLRCDGSGHGGCQAGCRIYWKEVWLRPVDRDAEAAEGVTAGPAEVPFVVEAAAERQRDSIFPLARKVVPAAVEEVFRPGAVNDKLAVDRRLVVTFEKLRDVAGLIPLSL